MTSPPFCSASHRYSKRSDSATSASNRASSDAMPVKEEENPQYLVHKKVCSVCFPNLLIWCALLWCLANIWAKIIRSNTFFGNFTHNSNLQCCCWWYCVCENCIFSTKGKRSKVLTCFQQKVSQQKVLLDCLHTSFGVHPTRHRTNSPHGYRQLATGDRSPRHILSHLATSIIDCYRQDLPPAALPVLFLLTGRFWGFATHCTDQCRIWHGGADHRFAPPCQISPWSVQGWGLRPPKLKKIGILPI